MPGCEEKENSRERLVHDRICASNVQAMGRAGILVKRMCWGLQGFPGEENRILHWFNVWCPGGYSLDTSRIECHIIEPRSMEATHGQPSYLAFPSLGP